MFYRLYILRIELSARLLLPAVFMGKASKWFRGLLGLKTGANFDQSSKSPKTIPKRKWSIVRRDRQKPNETGDGEASRHAVAVATATAAAAEAAVAAAQAAAAVVQLTSSGRNISTPGGGGEASGTVACGGWSVGGYRIREDWAAVTIQSHFRAYLSRRALRALKALVKLQALVKGHLVRKQTAYTLKRLQALVRAQVRARVGRVVVSESPHSAMKSSHFNYPGPATPEKFEHDVLRARTMKHHQLTMLKRKGSRSSGSVGFDQERSRPNGVCLVTTDDERSDKILEVDTGNSHSNTISKRRGFFYTSDPSHNCQSISTSKDSTAHCQSVLSHSEVQSLSPTKYVDETAFCTADNSPTYYLSSLRSGSVNPAAFTPAKSNGSRSCLSGYSDHPNYMSYTESSKAKVRSQSAPKQRPQYDRSGSTKRYSVHTAVQPNITHRVYPGSGLLDRFGMPIRGNVDGHWHKY